MADDRTIRVRFQAEVDSYIGALKRAGSATAEFGKNITGQGKATRDQMEQVGKGALLMAGTLTVALGASVKAAIDWESAWAGVNKTVDGTAAQMGELEDGLRGLARELPASHKEIAAVAEAAGQLGIQREAILGFTRVMVDLGETTNLSADEAATSIAQMMNIMGTAAGDVDNLAATLVALGNAGASTESEILDMALRLAGAGKLIGATEGEVLALSNAMASLGIQAQLGGGAMSRTLQNIYSAVQSGGDKLEGFAEVAKMSATEFADAFREDPVRAVDSFVKGLSRIEAEGGNVIATLSDLKIKGTQDLSVLLRLKGAGDLLTEGLRLQKTAWQENTALAVEAAKRYDTTASQLKVLKNNVIDLGIELGGVLLPALKSAAGGAQQMIQGFQALPDVVKTGAVGITGISTAVLGLVGIIGTVGPKIQEFRKSLIAMEGIGATIGNNLGKITAIAGGAMAAIALVTYAIGENAKRAAEAEKRVQGFVSAMREAGDAAEGTEEQISTLVSQNTDLADALARTNTTIHDLATAVSGSDQDFDTFARSLVASAEAAGASGDQIQALVISLHQMRGDSQQAATEVETLGKVEDETARQTGALTRAQKEQQQQTEDLTDAVKDLIDANRAALDPLFAMLDSLDANAEAQKAVIDAQNDGATSAEDLAAAHRAAAKSALDVEGAALSLAGAIESGTVNVEVAKAALEGWVAEGTVTAETAAEMGAQFDAAAARADKLAGERVTTLTAIDNATPTLAAVGSWIDRLFGRNHVLRVSTNAGSLLASAARLAAERESRWGSVTAYAAGGVTPAHITGRELMKYGEPATGGEAYIPRIGNPTRSLGILQTAAGWYGADVTKAGSAFTGGRSMSPAYSSAAQTSQTVEATLVVPVSIDGQQIMQPIRKQIRIQGGDVQQVLGK